MRMKKARRFILLACFFMCAGLSITVGATEAHAGVADRVKQFFQLPDEVGKLKEDVNRVSDEYNQTKKQLDETAKSLVQSQETQRQLVEQNKRLQEQNAALSQTISKLQQDSDARSRLFKRIRIAIYTAFGLIICYFAFGRVLRVALRSRH